MIGGIRIRRNPPRWKRWQIQTTRLTAAIVVTLVVAQAYLALAALGPLTNYDSGLYHLGAVEYSRLFPAIPGLASVYSPLGYATAEFPLAAALSAGPWGSEGLRLANGLLMAALALDVALRALQGRRGPGFFVAAVGLVAAWVPLLALSDYWVTSPSQDTAALVVRRGSRLPGRCCRSSRGVGRRRGNRVRRRHLRQPDSPSEPSLLV